MKGSVAWRCRALAPWLAALAVAVVAIALCVDVLRTGFQPVGALDLPALVLFCVTLLAVPACALGLAYRAHTREGRQRSEVESLLAIMRDVHAAAVGVIHAGQTGQQRRFARTGGAGDGNEFSWPQRQ